MLAFKTKLKKKNHRAYCLSQMGWWKQRLAQCKAGRAKFNVYRSYSGNLVRHWPNVRGVFINIAYMKCSEGDEMVWWFGGSRLVNVYRVKVFLKTESPHCSLQCHATPVNSVQLKPITTNKKTVYSSAPPNYCMQEQSIVSWYSIYNGVKWKIPNDPKLFKGNAHL